MNEPSTSDEFRELENAARVLAAYVRRLREAMHSLSLLREEIVGLQGALAELSPDAPDERSAEGSAGPSERAGAAAAAVEPEDGPAPLRLPVPAVNGAQNGATNGAGRTDEAGAEAPLRDDARPAVPGASVAVTVSTQGGSVDLVRLYRALQRLPQVAEMSLTSYNGGRAVLGLTTAAQPRELPIEAALQSAFPEGIIGDWTGDREFVAVITAAG